MLRPLFFLLTLTVAHAASLGDKISAATAGFSGTVSIFAKNLDTGATFALRPDDRVRTASTIKLPILCATFEAVKEGRLKWTELITLHDADKVSGSGILGEFSDGVKLPLVDLTHLMIVLSDNTATNLVIDQVTADYVNGYMDKLGLKGTRSMRKVRGDGADLKAPSGFSKAGLDPANVKYGLGSSTPREMVMLLERIENPGLVPPGPAGAVRHGSHPRGPSPALALYSPPARWPCGDGYEGISKCNEGWFDLSNMRSFPVARLQGD
jgi:beta-lactamase class A